MMENGGFGFWEVILKLPERLGGFIEWLTGPIHLEVNIPAWNIYWSYTAPVSWLYLLVGEGLMLFFITILVLHIIHLVNPFG